MFGDFRVSGHGEDRRLTDDPGRDRREREEWQEIEELVRMHGLGEDGEHIIIPLPPRDGRRRRCFLLKRRFMRIVFPEGHHADYPLHEVVEAILRYPESRLSEVMPYMHRETEVAGEPKHDEGNGGKEEAD